MRTTSTTRQAVFASLLWIGGALVLAGGAAGTESGASDLPLDPIVSQVVKMLHADVSEPLILQWLEATGRGPEDVGSQGLIALSDAGASQELISGLLGLVGKVSSRPSEPPSTAATSLEPSEENATRSGSVPEPIANGSSLEARFLLSGKRAWVDEDEPDSPREERWSVYLYLDGELIAWTRPTLQGEPVEARRAIQPGRRELRVVLQRYEELRRGWSYESLTVPTLVAFEARPGDPIEIEVDMKRIWGLWRNRKDGGPLSYVIRQGSEVLAENEGTGGNPDRWQPVCEDLEANFPDAQRVPRAFRSSMSRCVRWAALWSGAGESTSRKEILQGLAEYDFEPPVR